MNQLLDKWNEYKSIVNYRLEYEFDGGTQIDFRLKQTDFPHLIGLHKLIDIPIIRQFNDKNNRTVSAKFIISKIRKEELITDQIVKSSIFFPDIKQRFEYFSKENLLTLAYTDVIVDFNASLIGSNLKAKYILYEQKQEKGYNHLCVAEDSKANFYVESFFFDQTDLYIHNQNTIKINNIRIFDANGKVFLEETLS